MGSLGEAQFEGTPLTMSMIMLIAIIPSRDGWNTYYIYILLRFPLFYLVLIDWQSTMLLLPLKLLHN